MQLRGIFSLASQQAKWLERRQQTVAENIAHANTPGYISKDVSPFKSMLSRTSEALLRTNPLHMASAQEDDGIKTIEISGADSGSARVNIETELIKSTEIRTDFEQNMMIAKAFHRMLLNAVKA